MTNVVIIGGGHNALTAAFYLAKGGAKPLVLERRAEVGGGAITSELHPGFHCPTLSHELLLHRQIAADMDLRRHGLDMLRPDVRVCAPALDGPALVLHEDVAQSADALRLLNAKDADAYPRFREAIDRVAGVLAATFSSAPPSVDDPSAGDIWNLLKAGRAFRALGRRDGYRLLRWLPMPVADLTREWFEHPLLQATIAAGGLSGTMLGPRSAGSSLVMLMREAHRQLAGGSAIVARGGPGALTRAMAAAAVAAGVEIRTHARVERIVIRDNRVAGLVVDGKEIPATTVVSGADPRTTFLDLIEPMDLAPEFTAKIRNYRAAGTVAKVNLALGSLPHFRGVTGTAAIAGHIHIGPDLDALERAFDHAKYGERSESPWLDVTIPSILDSSLAPSGAHVASIYVHYAPYVLRNGDWATARDSLLASVLDVLDGYAPGIRGQIVASEVISPSDLHSQYGFAGGHIFHGELALDQLYAMRPVLGFGKYDSPIAGLYLCGAGTHPGGFMTGTSGRLAARRVLDDEVFR